MAAAPASARWIHAIRLAPQRGAGQDRALVLDLGESLVIALADGAGGTGHGDAAAQGVIDDVAAVAQPLTGDAWVDRLVALDAEPARLGHGQTTAIVLSVTTGGIDGACIGDSGAWRIRGADGTDNIDDLTAVQSRKPLLGDGGDPRALDAGSLGDGETLLVASDGLLRYARPADIARVASLPSLADAADALIALVRLRSGALQDDVSLVLCRAPRRA